MPDEQDYDEENAVTAGAAVAEDFVGTDMIYQNFAYPTHEPHSWPEGSNEARIAELTGRDLTVPGLSSSVAPPSST